MPTLRLFFVLFGAATTLVKDGAVEQQVRVLREQYKPFLPELQIELAGVRAAPEEELFFRQCAIRADEWMPKYYQPGTITVGVCDCAFAFGLAYNPWDARPHPPSMINSITLWYKAMPGSGNAWFGEGKTILAHEIGHRMGLFHTYEGSCSGNETYSDRCADTPRQRAQATGPCTAKAQKEVRCPGQPLPDMKNFMTATADSCQPKHFSPCQVARMRETLKKYPLPEYGKDEL